MIQSMTGYRKAVLQLPTKKITIEVKSLNSKNLDLNTRMPSYYREKELGIRKQLASSLVRGKVDFSIYVEMTAEETQTVINKQVIGGYIKELKELSEGKEIEFLEIAMRLPDVLQTVREEMDVTEWEQIAKGIDTAIEEIVQYRKDEAHSLEADFRERIANIK